MTIIMSVLLGSTFLCGCGNNKEEYRQIQVYKIDGTVKVERQGSSMDAYDNMQLQSEDVIETAADSYVQLKLDEDKYIMMEPDTKISLQASGNSVDSKTSIYVEQGAIVNQLEKPLSEESSYEVTTPNSTMAVRGTTFRVELTLDDNGDTHTSVAVYGGQVECKLVFPDGTTTEPVMVEPGTEVIIFGDEVKSEYVGSGNVSYEELRLKVLEFLEVVIEKGDKLSITKEELQVLKDALSSLTEEETTEEESSQEEKTEEESDEEESGEEESSETPEETTESEENTSEEEKDDTPPATTPSDDYEPGSDDAEDDSSEEDESEEEESTEEEPVARNVIVTFYCDGQVYATQKLTTDSNATSISVAKPELQPFSGVAGWQIEKSNKFWIKGFDESDAGYPVVFQSSDSETISFKAGKGELNISFVYTP